MIAKPKEIGPSLLERDICRRAGTVMLLSFLLLGSPMEGAAYVTASTYSRCHKSCKSQFRPVLPGESNCEQALRQIRHDLIIIRTYLRTKRICRGRHRKKCIAFKGKAIRSLGFLVTAIGGTDSCASLDMPAIRSHLWGLSMLHSCRGDRKYTDLHDLMGRRVRLLGRITARGTTYKLSRERITHHPEYKPSWPQCEGRQKPARYYVWPLFEFLLALESVGEMQTCLADCRPPTAQERRLEELLGQLDDLSVGVGAAAEDLRLLMQARSDRLHSDLGREFECPRLAAVRLEVETLVGELDGLLKAVDSLTILDPPPQSSVSEAVYRTAMLERRVDGIGLSEVQAECIAQEELAKELVRGKRQVLRAVEEMRNLTSGIARRYDDLGKAGEECSWTTDCCVPLICEGGQCTGEISMSDVLPLLAETERIGSEVGKVAIFTESGFDRETGEVLDRYAHDLNKVESRLSGLGWMSAVRRWGKAYAVDLTRQMASVQARNGAILGEVEAIHAASPTPGSSCGELISSLRELSEELGRVKEKVGSNDPVLDPTWVRLRTDDVRIVGRRVAELEQLAANQCRPVVHSGNSVSRFLWLAAGLILLATVLGLVVVRQVRRR